MKPPIPPILQFLLCGAIAWGIAVVTPLLEFDSHTCLAAAIVFILAGAMLLICAIAVFVQARTTINPLEPGRAEKLVTTGLYRFTRNPMYLALALILIGGALLLGNLGALTAPALFVWSMTTLQIKPEEIALQTKFGEDYAAYRRRTRRWI